MTLLRGDGDPPDRARAGLSKLWAMNRSTGAVRYLALALELGGAGAVLYAVATWSVPAAIALGGVLLIVAAQFLGELP